MYYKIDRSVCKHDKAVDLTHGYGEHPNIWCCVCGDHWFKGKRYSVKEWDEWMNSEEA